MASPQRLSYLFRRYMERTCTPEEKDEFFSLLLHAGYDDQLRRLIADTWNEDLPSYPQDKARADDILQRIVNRREPESPPGAAAAETRLPSWRRYRVALSLAAAVIGILLIPVVYFHFLRHPHPKPANVLPATALAKRSPPADRCITLPDGSKVLLHQNARLDFRSGFTATRREVSLFGEAFFDIRHDARPFVVHTGVIQTTVLGTAFDIDAHSGHGVVITVTKGKVKVENGKGEVSILRRNEQLSVDSTYGHLQKSTVDAGRALAWKRAYLIFNDIPMREAMDELARRYHISVAFADAAAENCPVTATFVNGESVETMIKVLTKINHMEFNLDHGRVTITGNGCK